MPSEFSLHVELLLTESSGPFFKPGSPRLVCCFHALFLAGTPHAGGKVSVLAPDAGSGTWRESVAAVTLEEACELLTLLNAIGLPKRIPDVQGIVDTSDRWSQIVLWVRTGDCSQCVSIDMHSSGFEGADAETLRQVCRRLFRLAGYQEYSQTLYAIDGLA